jgi:hypothetical protein
MKKQKQLSVVGPTIGQVSDLSFQSQNYLDSLPMAPAFGEDRLKEGVELLIRLKDHPAESEEEAALFAIQQGKILNALKKGFSSDPDWQRWAFYNLHFISERKCRALMLIADRPHLHKYAKLGIKSLLDVIKITGNADAEVVESFIRRNYL